MKIDIARKLLPFSQDPGTKTVLLGTELILQFFPSLILSSSFSVNVLTSGPVERYEVFNNVESGKITVFGKLNTGMFRYVIYLKGRSEITIQIEKDTTKQLRFIYTSHDEMLPLMSKLSDSLYVIQYKKRCHLTKPLLEKLSLGNHKKQDMVLVQRRGDLKEIMPLWFAMGQWASFCQEDCSQQENTLLGLAQKAVLNSPRDHISGPIYDLYRTSFSGIFAPRLTDEDFYGFALPPFHGNTPFYILYEGMKLIRSLFIQEEESLLRFLPKLPSEFHCGRMVNISAFQKALCIDLEWTKGKLFKVILRGCEKIEFSLSLQKEIKTFRLRYSLQDKGVVLSPSETLAIAPGQKIYLDRFTK